MAALLDRPGGFRRHAGVATLGFLHRVAASRFAGIAGDERAGIGPELEQVLGRTDLKLAALVSTDDARPGRSVIAIVGERGVLAVAKAAPCGSVELGTEDTALRALECAAPRFFRTPKLLASFRWRGLDVAVQEVLPVSGQTGRPARELEAKALTELAGLSHHLAGTLAGGGPTAVHGDFCGWNTGSVGNAQLGVWDWEWARMGLPLEDHFHWEVQRLLHFGHGSVDVVVESALRPTPRQKSLYRQLGACSDIAPTSLAASLRAALLRLGTDVVPERVVRESILARVECAL